MQTEPRTVSIPEALQLGVDHHQAGRLAEAERIYQQILAAEPGNPHALQLLGLAAHMAGKHERAIELMLKALVRIPGEPVVLNNLGEAYRSLGKFDEAIACYDKALAAKPDYAECKGNRGIALSELGRHAEALAAFDQALAANPRHAWTLSNRGIVLQELGRNEEALASLDQALAIDPAFAAALSNRGNALRKLRRYDEALEACDKALALKPDFHGALANRANVLEELGRHDEALALYDKALALKPDFDKAWGDRGIVLQELGRFDEALASYAKALAIAPGFAHAHYNEGLCRLMLGEFEQGWEKYEWRWAASVCTPRTFTQPRWSGKEPVRGKTVLLHAEQGLGDTIQFARYARDIAKKGARVVLEVQPVLHPLFAGIPEPHKVVKQGDPLPAFDFHCPLLSLPRAFGTRLGTIPAPIPYLSVKKAAAAKWRKQFAAPGTRLVGLAWKGDPDYRKDRDRSIRLADLKPLFATPGVRFVSLQKDLDDEERALTARMENFVHPGASFKDTAEMIGALDLVVSVDTAWAHWAGATGKPLWVLLAFMPHWIWQLDRADNPWYPTARLFRQREVGEWGAPIKELAKELRRSPK